MEKKKYTLCVPLIATATYDIEAENLSEAWEIAEKAHENCEIDYDGYDPEWGAAWIDED